MKINLDGRVNFVDQNNIFVGFEVGTQCFETYGWAILNECYPDSYVMYFIEDQGLGSKFLQKAPEDIEDYDFEKGFFDIGSDYMISEDQDIIVFSLYNRKKMERLFLHLFNFHDGYSTHELETNITGESVLHNL